ncbi:hypothetical protein NKH77_33800 [Streptomyces sp. M19]
MRWPSSSLVTPRATAGSGTGRTRWAHATEEATPPTSWADSSAIWTPSAPTLEQRQCSPTETVSTSTSSGTPSAAASCARRSNGRQMPASMTHSAGA